VRAAVAAAVDAVLLLEVRDELQLLPAVLLHDGGDLGQLAGVVLRVDRVHALLHSLEAVEASAAGCH
jgi:hypothetical protein